MRILPVIDLMNGIVVRGIGGRRQEYRPIVSRLTKSTVPLDVASSFRDHLGLDEFYLADLDAIAGRPPSLKLVAELLDKGFRLWVDAGIGVDMCHVQMLADCGVQNIIAGLESLDGSAQLQTLVNIHGPSRLVFSLDMNAGKPLASDSWNAADSWDIAWRAIQLGVQRILVLDLAAVGADQGMPAADLCGRLRRAFPALDITTGGGVRDIGDLHRLRQLGVDNVLIASALHDGRLSAEDLLAWRQVSNLP
jgi:phosphoribosylformimino-5-aminoimidazole carboxamide ribotide isomerase